jgi:hypothetical protein
MSHSIEHSGLFVDFGMITIGSHKFIELETKVNHTMPTLRWAIGPHQWKSFHLDKKSCLIYIGKIVVAINVGMRCTLPIMRDSS